MDIFTHKYIIPMKTLIVYGPTATGKTALGMSLANKYQGAIISADSRQVYKGLDIGSGKVSFDDKVEKYRGYWLVNGVKIYGFDLCPPGKGFTAADFINATISSLAKIEHEDKLPIIVGGTGFYVKSLLGGLQSFGIPANENLRADLDKQTKDQLKDQLKKVDKKKFDSMNTSDINNPRRLIRAIEIALDPSNSKGIKPLVTKAHVIGLTASNSYLYKKSDAWLQTRLDSGLIEEIENLIKKKTSIVWLEGLGLEYRWITRYLTGKLSYGQAINSLIGDTHDLIRRQKSWFKKFEGIKIYDIEDKNYQEKLEKDL